MSAPIPNQQALGYSSGPNYRYAAPTDGGDGPGYVDSPVGAWSVTLRNAPGDTPDPLRGQQYPVRDYRPDPRFSADYFWSGIRGPGTERILRHGVEFQDGDGMAAIPPGSHRSAPDPRWIPPDEPRVTSRLSPHTYVFTRPFDQDIERSFTGHHFSMADHRRRYPILGMATPPYRRNTYRTDPVPWDVGRVDMPAPAVNVTPSGQVRAFDIPPSGSGNSWRL